MGQQQFSHVMDLRLQKERENPPAGFKQLFYDITQNFKKEGPEGRRALAIRKKAIVTGMIITAFSIFVKFVLPRLHATKLEDSSFYEIDNAHEVGALHQDTLGMSQALRLVLKDGRLKRLHPTAETSSCAKELSSRGQATLDGPVCGNGCGDKDCTAPESAEAEGGKDWKGDFLYQSNCAHCVYFQTAGFPPGTIFQWPTRSKEADTGWYVSLKPCSKPAEQGLAFLPIDDPSLVKRKCFHSLPATVKKAELNALVLQLNKVGAMVEKSGVADWPPA